MTTLSISRHALATLALSLTASGCDPAPGGDSGDSATTTSMDSGTPTTVGSASGASSSDGTDATDSSGSSGSSSSGAGDTSGSGSTDGGSTDATSGSSSGTDTGGESSSSSGGCEPAPGAWVDCSAGEDCGSDDAECVALGQGDLTSCLFTPNAGAGCVDTCDCPAAPETGDAVVACGDAELDGGPDGCFLDCSGGATCPDGQSCFADLVCGWPTYGAPVYAPCNPPTVLCEDGSVCLTDGSPATLSTCVQSACLSTATCAAAPAGGTAVCADLSPVLLGNECYLQCLVDADCPVGGTCLDATICVFPVP